MVKKRKIALLILSLIAITLTACAEPQASVVPESVSSVVETSVEPSVEPSVEEPEPEPAPVENPIMYVNDEGYLVFGNYEQDGDETNGLEPIEWEILATDDTGVLLISRYVLDCRQFDPNMASVTWGSSDLRIWLNTDFLNTAFTLKEQKSILEVTSENTPNEYYNTDAGNETKEKVFVLSVKQLIDNYEFEIWEDERLFGISQKLLVPATAYAVSQGVATTTFTENYATENDEMHRFLNDNLFKSTQIEEYIKKNTGNTGAQWWLRTPGNKQFLACTVNEYGRGGYFYGQNITKKDVGVRPAIYIEALP